MAAAECARLLEEVDRLHAKRPLSVIEMRKHHRAAAGTRAFSSMYMTFAGQEWKYGEKAVGYFLNPDVPPVPAFILDLGRRAFAAALEKQPGAFPHEPPWQRGSEAFTCLVNYYPPKWGTIPEHADDDEPSLKQERYFPVISMSLGDSATFLLHPAGEAAPVSVDLRSGDVLLFGGNKKARLMRHSIPTPPTGRRYADLKMIPGRVNVTLRAI